jgi:hypothetical protein
MTPREAVEQIHQLGKVGQGPGQPVDLVDHHDVDLTRLDLGKQGLQRRAVQGTSRYPAIVELAWNQPPALVGVALYICLAGLPLGIQRVELQVQVMFGRFAGVDGAAAGFSGLSHGRTPLIMAMASPDTGLPSASKGPMIAQACNDMRSCLIPRCRDGVTSGLLEHLE